MSANTSHQSRTSKATYDPTASIVRPRHLRHAVGLSPTTAWRLRQRGQFPEPIRLTARACGWRRADLVAWLDSRTPGRIA